MVTTHNSHQCSVQMADRGIWLQLYGSLAIIQTRDAEFEECVGVTSTCGPAIQARRSPCNNLFLSHSIERSAVSTEPRTHSHCRRCIILDSQYGGCVSTSYSMIKTRQFLKLAHSVHSCAMHRFSAIAAWLRVATGLAVQALLEKGGTDRPGTGCRQSIETYTFATN